MAQTTSMEILGPCAVEWLKSHLSARLEWARDHELTLQDMTISATRGTINSVQMGLLLDAGIHRVFDGYGFSLWVRA